MKSTEQKIYGRNACLSFAKSSPKTVIRAYCTEENRGRLGSLLKFLASQKRAYHIVSSDDLNKICESEHHEGVCLLVERMLPGDETQLLKDIQAEPKIGSNLLLCLDGITNPHNLGAITRTAAHFGIKKIFLCNIPVESQKSLVSGAFHRTAEGGAVHVELYCSAEGKSALEALKKQHGWNVFATSSYGRSQSLHKISFPQKLILVMGSESQGVSDSILQIADSKVCINGTGHVESLNVASATAILLNEYARQKENYRSAVSRPTAIPTRAVRAEGRNRKGS